MQPPVARLDAPSVDCAATADDHGLAVQGDGWADVPWDAEEAIAGFPIARAIGVNHKMFLAVGDGLRARQVQEVDARMREFKATVRCIPLVDSYDGAGKCIVTGADVDRRVEIAKAY